MKELIKKLCSVRATSGDEDGIISLIKKEISPYCDEIKTDATKNLIALKKGNDSTKKLMLSAHTDEIGFIVNYIDDKGYIRVSSLGYIEWNAFDSTEVEFSSGIYGVLVRECGEDDKKPTADKFYIDIGAKDKKEAERLVSIGERVSAVSRFYPLAKDRISARPLDDRIGCALLIECAKKCRTPAYDTYYVFSSQEEVGCRGARTAAYTVAPDYSLAVDVTDTGDAIGAKPMAVALGGGAAIKLKDSSVICSPLVTDRLRKLCKKHSIKHQLEIIDAGGTDSGEMQSARGGSLCGAVSIPLRYMHTSSEVADMGDVTASFSLLSAFIEEGM